MIDQGFESPVRLEVRTDGNSGPYLVVVPEQVEDVRLVLREADIPHEIHHDAAGVTHDDNLDVVRFYKHESAERIQDALDAAE